jgi:hypothetical protein
MKTKIIFDHLKYKISGNITQHSNINNLSNVLVMKNINN